MTVELIFAEAVKAAQTRIQDPCMSAHAPVQRYHVGEDGQETSEETDEKHNQQAVPLLPLRRMILAVHLLRNQPLHGAQDGCAHRSLVNHALGGKGRGTLYSLKTNRTQKIEPFATNECGAPDLQLRSMETSGLLSRCVRVGKAVVTRYEPHLGTIVGSHHRVRHVFAAST